MGKILITSNCDYVVQISNETFFVDNKQYIEVLDNDGMSLTFLAYPINDSKNSLPYAVNLDLKNSNTIPKNVKVYKLKDRCEIELLPYIIPSVTPLYSFNQNITGEIYRIICYIDRVQISSKYGEYVYESAGFNHSCSVHKNLIYVLSRNYDIKNLVIFDTKNNTFTEIKGEKIEIQENTIKSLSKTNIQKHQVLTTYNIDDNITMKSIEYFCEGNSQNPIGPKEMVPYMFFESIKIKDYVSAKKYLTESFSQKLNIKMLSSFFGDIQYVRLYTLKPLVYTVYNIDNAKDYKISMINDAICEIEEI